MLEGVCAALQAAGKTLPDIGVDGSDEAAALIKSGQATGTALQQFAVIAEKAVVPVSYTHLDVYKRQRHNSP